MDQGMSAEEIAPIAILMDELRSDDVQLRLNAIHSIPTIALALGPDRARDELIPFLQESMDDEDEVLLALAEELGRGFEEYIGGKDYAHLLLVPLETLSSTEETLVRDKAAESITHIADVMSPAQIEEHYIPLLKRLSSGEWFTSRTTSAALYPPVYDKVSAPLQDELRKSYAALGSDDTPMVRRAAAKWLGPLVKRFSAQHVVSDALPIYRRLQSDDQDSVRLLTVEDLIVLAGRMSPADVKDQLLKQISSSITDKSWRVRYMAASHFNELAEAVGTDLVRSELLNQYVALLKDNEAEVRSAASSQIPGFSKLLDKDSIVSRIIPCVQALAQDTSQHVRSALAKEITGLAPLLGRESTIEFLLPLFLTLLKDDFPEVRLNIISKLEVVDSVIGIELLSENLLPAIIELAEDKSWRVRQAIIEYIPLLAKQLGKAFFDEQLGNLCMSWLGDTVYSIRESATLNLKKLTDVFGVEWARTSIVPKIMSMGQHPNYLFRMTTVQAITTIAPSLSIDIIRSDIIDPLLQRATDDIPNIRFNVAKSLEVLAATYGSDPEGKTLIQQRIIPVLEQMRNDQDADVRYFASRALQKALSSI
ncbi:ARM repeat-containing protein [Schizophyllum commune H4-8]|uniref:Protein phosphatase PP2A regulatory subunit A n=1 Tax=Schizophyllum commune (strain H4-8 / FGSC 9210) TaxID=578458 RepID=D8PQ53_SCHCM|nr:ARM repeat-containing protein [Schizophyllum commune H4-8]KAI5898281.1 ARM repeat-containing protein [Schizophyllum commune H4-8]